MFGYILVMFLRSVITLDQPHFEIISIMSVFLNDSCHEGTFQDQEKAEKKKKKDTNRQAEVLQDKRIRSRKNTVSL